MRLLTMLKESLESVRSHAFALMLLRDLDLCQQRLIHCVKRRIMKGGEHSKLGQKEGWLHTRKAKETGQWKRRFFSLKDGRLSYFKSEQVAQRPFRDLKVCTRTGGSEWRSTCSCAASSRSQATMIDGSPLRSRRRRRAVRNYFSRQVLRAAHVYARLPTGRVRGGPDELDHFSECSNLASAGCTSVAR